MKFENLKFQLGICENDVEYCLFKCEEALNTYVGNSCWTEKNFYNLVLSELKEFFSWDYPTEGICEALLRATTIIAEQNGVQLSYYNNGLDTNICIIE